MTGRERLTLDGIRPWLPWIVMIAAGLATWIETRVTVARDDDRLAVIEKYLTPESVEKNVRWKVGVERDIQDLQRRNACGR